MNAMRWLGRLILAGAVLLQFGYALRTYSAGHSTATWWYPLAPALGFSVLVFFDRGRVASLLRIVLGAIFALSACDRFGIFHKTGTAGAALEPIAHFVSFAPKVDAAFPHQIAPWLSIAVSWSEAVLAIALLTGFASRIFCSLAAIVLAAYSFAMLQTGGANAVLSSAPLVLLGASLVIAAGVPAATGAAVQVRRPRKDLDPFLFAFDEAQQRAARFPRA